MATHSSSKMSLWSSRDLPKTHTASNELKQSLWSCQYKFYFTIKCVSDFASTVYHYSTNGQFSRFIFFHLKFLSFLLVCFRLLIRKEPVFFSDWHMRKKSWESGRFRDENYRWIVNDKQGREYKEKNTTTDWRVVSSLFLYNASISKNCSNKKIIVIDDNLFCCNNSTKLRSSRFKFSKIQLLLLTDIEFENINSYYTHS